jgi:hypothetical protein
VDQAATKGEAGRDALYKVAYEEAVRALSDQRLEIDSVHSRTGLLLSVAAVATSFLGAQALEGGSLSPMSWLALAGFIATALVSLAILLPYQGEFSADAREVIETYIEALDRLATLFQAACGLLTIEMIFWILSIAL